ncbi:unnamed protein product, partial [Brassica rapa subsp. narinosa]
TKREGPSSSNNSNDARSKQRCKGKQCALKLGPACLVRFRTEAKELSKI